MAVEYVDPSESEGLSRDAIIAIAVSSGVAGLAVVVAWVAIVACCCMMREKPSRPQGRQSPEKYVCCLKRFGFESLFCIQVTEYL